MTWLLNAGRAIANSPTWLIIVLAVLFLLILIYVFIQIWRYGVRRAKLPKTDDPDTRLNYLAQSMRSSFIAAHKSMADFFPGSNFRYSNPVFVMLGPSGSGKTDLLDNSGLSTKLGQVTGGSPCDWKIFDRATVLDLRGDLVFEGNDPNKKARGWNTLINLFQRFRPKRPIDGLIITIPAELCLDNTDRDKMKLAEMGETIHRRIGELQSRLGMSLPIYFIITKSEAMTGFKATASLIPAEYQADAFGWSSPYPPDATYSSNWCHEALSDLVQRLQDSISEILTLSPPKGYDHRDAVLFPTTLERIGSSLELLLSRILRISNFNKSATLRGIYFTASSNGGSAVGGTVNPNTGNFVTNLLERKIFPEFALAYPFNLNMLSTNKRVRFAQFGIVATVFLSIFGLTHSWHYLDETSSNLSSAMNAISSSAEQLRLARLDGITSSDLMSVKEGMAVMNKFEMMGDGDLELLTVPTTWFDSLNDRVIEIINLSYDRLLYKEMFLWLTDRGEQITNLTGQTEKSFIYYYNTKAPVVLSKNSTFDNNSSAPDYSIIDNYLGTLLTFERMVDRYQRIQPDKDTIALRTVSEYLYDLNLTPQFIEAITPTLFGGRKNKISIVDLQDLQPAAQNRMEIIWEDFILNWISRDGLVDQLMDLSNSVDIGFNEASVSKRDYQRLDKMKMALANIRANLNSGRYDWLAKEDAELPDEFEARLKLAESRLLLGGEIRARMIRIFNRIHFEGRKRFLEYPMPAVGAVIEVKDGRLALSDHLEELYQKLERAEEQDKRNNIKVASNLSNIEEDIPTSAPMGQYVIWDVQVLKNALEDARGYQDLFAPKETNQGGEGSLNETVNELTRHSVAKRIASQISIAIKFRRIPFSTDMASMESALGDRVANFGKAIKPLQELFDILLQTGSEKIYQNSSKLVVSEAIDVLMNASKLLEGSRPYAVRQERLDEWDGITPPMQQLVGIRNNSQVPSYVDFQRERVSFLANQYAAPALDFLLDQETSRAVVAIDELSTWLSIMNDLNAYETMQAKNPILELETFILDYLTKIDCESIEPMQVENPTDVSWFEERLINLHEGMINRCEMIQMASLVSSYKDLSDNFNKVLAGNQPFSLGSFYGKSVSAQTIQSYFLQFNNFMNLGGGDPLMFWPEEDRNPIDNFITKMDKAAYVFAQALNPDEIEAAPSWTLEPEFRVNREYESQSDQIIKWELTSGTRTASLYQPGQRVQWSPGNKIKISFTWALDSDHRPKRDSKRSDLSVNGRTATFTYANEWALFSAIDRNRANVLETSKSEKNNYHILRFEVPVIQTPKKTDAKEQIYKGKAIFFIALRVYGSSAMGTKRLEFPTLPVQAPLYESFK